MKVVLSLGQDWGEGEIGSNPRAWVEGLHSWAGKRG